MQAPHIGRASPGLPGNHASQLWAMCDGPACIDCNCSKYVRNKHDAQQYIRGSESAREISTCVAASWSNFDFRPDRTTANSGTP